MESNWWFVPEILADGLNNLYPIPDEPINGSQVIKKASALTIYLHSVYVATSKDPQGKVKKRPGNCNDLFISSNHKTGSTPKVQRIHYYKDKEPINKLFSNFFDFITYSTKDLSNDIFNLNIRF